MSNKIIGVAGQLASAKDTVTNYLVEKLNGDGPFIHDFGVGNAYVDRWIRVGFADAVKRVFMDAFHVNLEFIEEWKRKDEIPAGFNVPVRKALQHIGDGFRQIQSDIWIRTALRIESNKIISDVRYVNEAKMIKEKGGKTILLWRKGFENNDPNPSEAQIKPFVDWCAKNYEDGPIPKDSGMKDLQYFDFFLRNDGDLTRLYNKIDELVIPFLKSDL